MRVSTPCGQFAGCDARFCRRSSQPPSFAAQALGILTVKVGSSGATWVAAGSATEELSSLSTFWSSALTAPARKAALAAAAATLNFILEMASLLSRAGSRSTERGRGGKRGQWREEGSVDEDRRQDAGWAMMSLRLEEKRENHGSCGGQLVVVNLKPGRRFLTTCLFNGNPELELLLLRQTAGWRGRRHGGAACSRTKVALASLQNSLEPCS